ncbi:MAG: YbaN family protein [Marinomonas foliarum]|uniref:YbaN family protein n=1 Tax=Marinomonas foliarum TaxID=491950 RepID=UPI003F9543E6
MVIKGKVFIYKLVAALSLMMAFVGVMVPGIPATEFILLCAWSSSKGSPKINAFLHTNRFTGPVLYNWNNGKVISRNNKILSSISMLLCVFFVFYSEINVYLVVFALFGISIGFIFVWSRPSHLKTDKEL